MDYENIMDFKKNVHDPIMQKIFERTELKEGSRFIDYMHICYPDGRNSGHDSRIYVSGFEFINGKSAIYEREIYDISVKQFMEGMKEIPFIFDGKVCIEDENLSIKLETELCSLNYVAPLFPEVADVQPTHRLFQSMEYEKLKCLCSERNEVINCSEVKERK